MPDLRSDLEALMDEMRIKDTVIKSNGYTEVYADRLTALLSAHPAGPDLRALVMDAIPSNWCDPLLNGPYAVIHDAPCPEVEALLNGIRARITDALTAHTEAGEWRGPWKCENFGLVMDDFYESLFHRGRSMCDGRFRPYERRKGGA